MGKSTPKKAWDDIRNTINRYLEKQLPDDPQFTGKLELNFKDGEAKDVRQTKRTKFVKLKKE